MLTCNFYKLNRIGQLFPFSMWEIWTWEMFTVHQLVSVYLKLSRDWLNSAQACLVFFSYNLPVTVSSPTVIIMINQTRLKAFN